MNEIPFETERIFRKKEEVSDCGEGNTDSDRLLQIVIILQTNYSRQEMMIIVFEWS